ncbi:MAG TPA: surface-adhesin E family protein [Pararobbsia sp.]|nr:surface-adhesin E family protein [Pararobbsia sp.]
MRKMLLSALCAALSCAMSPASVFAQPLEDWIPVAQSDIETLLMKRTAAEIYPDGTRRAFVKTAYKTPQSAGGIEFTTTVARVVFDCKTHQAKIVHTDFVASSGEIAYADDTPDAQFASIKPESEPALIEQIVCQQKGPQKGQQKSQQP